MIDTRVQTPNVWRRLLYPPKQEEDRTVTFRYKRDRHGDQSLAIDVPGLRSHLTFPLLMNVYVRCGHHYFSSNTENSNI